MSAAASSNNVYLSDISGQPAATSIVDVKVEVMEMAPRTPPREDRKNKEEKEMVAKKEMRWSGLAQVTQEDVGNVVREVVPQYRVITEDDIGAQDYWGRTRLTQDDV